MHAVAAGRMVLSASASAQLLVTPVACACMATLSRQRIAVCRCVSVGNCLVSRMRRPWRLLGPRSQKRRFALPQSAACGLHPCTPAGAPELVAPGAPGAPDAGCGCGCLVSAMSASCELEPNRAPRAEGRARVMLVRSCETCAAIEAIGQSPPWAPWAPRARCPCVRGPRIRAHTQRHLPPAGCSK